jgi:hypothetical protein
MRTATIAPYDITLINNRRTLIVRYRLYEDGRWRKNGFWRFTLPVDEADIFERAYLELQPNRVYAKPHMFIKCDEGIFY